MFLKNAKRNHYQIVRDEKLIFFRKTQVLMALTAFFCIKSRRSTVDFGISSSSLFRYQTTNYRSIAILLISFIYRNTYNILNLPVRYVMVAVNFGVGVRDIILEINFASSNDYIIMCVRKFYSKE